MNLSLNIEMSCFIVFFLSQKHTLMFNIVLVSIWIFLLLLFIFCLLIFVQTYYPFTSHFHNSQTWNWTLVGVSNYLLNKCIAFWSNCISWRVNTRKWIGNSKGKKVNFKPWPKQKGEIIRYSEGTKIIYFYTYVCIMYFIAMFLDF